MTHDAIGPARVAVFGAGAVGCAFGGMLARAGIDVTLIGRPRHVEAIAREGLRLESVPLAFDARIPVTASIDPASVRSAGLVLFCVKARDTEDAARALAPHVAPGATVVSLQNGIDNAERIHGATGIPALPAVVYIAAEMAGAGHVRHTGRGDLILGPAPGGPDPAPVAAFLARAGVRAEVSDDIARDLWMKLIVNCAYNPVSALARARYGVLMHSPAALALMRSIVDEAVAVAASSGVRLETDAAYASCLAVGRSMEGAISSMAQDLARGARTEIEALNGAVVDRGKRLRVPTPVNETLHALVRLLEDQLPADPRARGS